MGRPEDIVRAREQSKRDAAVSAAQVREGNAEAARTHRWSEVQAAIPPALVALNAAGWPNGVLVRWAKPAFFGSKYVENAGIKLAEAPFDFKGHPSTTWIYLLSRGVLVHGGPGSAELVVPEMLGIGRLSHFPFDDVVHELRAMVSLPSAGGARPG